MPTRQRVTQYLTLTGVLYPDNRLELEPGFLTSDATYAVEERDGALVAELADDQGTTILRFRLPHGVPCTDGALIDARLVAAKVPFPRHTRLIRFTLDGVVIHELQVPTETPTVRLAWDLGEVPSGVRVVRWSGEHRQSLPLQYLLSYSSDDGRTWQPLSLPIGETEQDVDFDRLPGGRACRLRVLATDGVNTTQAVSEAFERPTQPCYPMILEPDDGRTYQGDEMVTMRGEGYYLEEGEPELEELRWSSSRDGHLGTGSMVATSGLTPGPHTITLGAGVDGRVGTAAVSIQVG